MSKDRETREERERGRVYRARQEFHASRLKRRRRDDLIAGIVGGLIVLAAIGSQIAYFTAGPGAPAPEPAPTTSVSPEPSPAPTDGATPAPESTPVGTDAP